MFLSIPTLLLLAAIVYALGKEDAENDSNENSDPYPFDPSDTDE